MNKKLQLLAEGIRASGLVKPELLKEEKFFDKPFTKDQVLNILENVGVNTEVYNFDYLIREFGIRGIINEAKGPANFFLPIALATTLFSGANAINKANQIQPIISNAETQYVQAIDDKLQNAINDRGAYFADLLAGYKADLDRPGGAQDVGPGRVAYVNDYFETLANAKPGETTMIAKPKPYAINVPVSSFQGNPKFHNITLRNIKPGGMYDINLPKETNLDKVQDGYDFSNLVNNLGTIDDKDHEALEKEAKENARQSVAGQIAPLQKDVATSGALAAGAGLWGLGSAVRRSKEEELGLEETVEFSQFARPKKAPKLFTTGQLVSLFESLKLDTKKYTVNYLAEQLGFVDLIEATERQIRLANQTLSDPSASPEAKDLARRTVERQERGRKAAYAFALGNKGVSGAENLAQMHKGSGYANKHGLVGVDVSTIGSPVMNQIVSNPQAVSAYNSKIKGMAGDGISLTNPMVLTKTSGGHGVYTTPVISNDEALAMSGSKRDINTTAKKMVDSQLGLSTPTGQPVNASYELSDETVRRAKEKSDTPLPEPKPAEDDSKAPRQPAYWGSQKWDQEARAAAKKQ
jgi:hypothetical protein